MSERIEVLDHGYVDVVEAHGSDESIIEAARMSTGKGFLGWGPKCPKCSVALLAGERHIGSDVDCHMCRQRVTALPGDEKLLKFLWDNKHATPFEMAGMTIEVQAPIFVFREWHRHRTQSYNEMSARYAPLPDVNYVPSIERLMINSGGTNKQAGTVAGSTELTESAAKEFRESLAQIYIQQEKLYQTALFLGVPKEVARVHLPVGRYSRMRASANLRNWLAFLTLRSDKNPGAQWEIRQFANAVGTIVASRFPRTWALFDRAGA